MNNYIIKLEISADIEAFSIEDARDYISDIFNIDDEIKSVKIIKISEK